MSDLIAILLADQDLPRQALAVRKRAEHVIEQLRGMHEVGARPLEQVEELAVAGAKEGGERGHT